MDGVTVFPAEERKDQAPTIGQLLYVTPHKKMPAEGRRSSCPLACEGRWVVFDVISYKCRWKKQFFWRICRHTPASIPGCQKGMWRGPQHKAAGFELDICVLEKCLKQERKHINHPEAPTCHQSILGQSPWIPKPGEVLRKKGVGCRGHQIDFRHPPQRKDLRLHHI